MSARVEGGRWQRRATRARRLAGGHAAMAETLHFYAHLAELQETLVDRHSKSIARPAADFADRLDPGAALEVLPGLLNFVKGKAPAALADELRVRGDDDYDRWRHRIHTYWITGGREAWDADPIERFVLEAFLVPFAESLVSLSPSPASADVSACAVCTGLPVVALLREQAHGAKRSLVCGFCLSEAPSPRLQCPHCGETAVELLPVFRSDEFAAVRIDACESCKTYVKIIDLTRDGEASPIVDDIASMPLDVWAREKDYRRLRPNLFGF